ncbi:BCNT-domain-containing protein [Lojkania enalia]|uniref:SWR1-complex protein 5 n=1 Tax=Lojkania enalia TaxID=147567 RepID=A0A9P4K2H8_9PLEO|nr:BCNT-domain-containing protein [Didymosphaeria enalia]
MELADPIEDLLDADDNYHESSDEDFNPNAAQADEASSSSDEETDTKPSRKSKRKAPRPEELDSGDEVTIEAARKRRGKKRKGGKADDDEDIFLSDNEGGEGGLIKTRAQRRVEQKERKPLARIEGATADVEALWAQMSAAPLEPFRPPPASITDNAKDEDVLMGGVEAPMAIEREADMVIVKKVYTFAGQRTTEEKQIPRSFLEHHLADGWKVVEDTADIPPETNRDGVADTEPKVHRPVRRPSRFDPNPTGYVRGLPPEHQLTWPRKAITVATGQGNILALDAPRVQRLEKAQKLNVVDKSRLDWTGFVDKEGIAEELATHGKTKEAYLGRMEFLANVEARQQEERLRTKAAS